MLLLTFNLVVIQAHLQILGNLVFFNSYVLSVMLHCDTLCRSFTLHLNYGWISVRIFFRVNVFVGIVIICWVINAEGFVIIPYRLLVIRIDVLLVFNLFAMAGVWVKCHL
ncbi:hypothetical protein D3C73_1343690 [compost metagenome]